MLTVFSEDPCVGVIQNWLNGGAVHCPPAATNLLADRAERILQILTGGASMV